MSTEMRSGMLLFAQRFATMYRARVKKVRWELAKGTKAETTVIQTRYGPRYAGVVRVDSEHFLPHEQGWTDEDGQYHPGAHDFNEILSEMAGHPVGRPRPSGPSVPKDKPSVPKTERREPERVARPPELKAQRPEHQIEQSNLADSMARRRYGAGKAEAYHYRKLKEYTARVEAEHGRDAASIGRNALESRKAVRRAKGLPEEPLR